MSSPNSITVFVSVSVVASMSSVVCVLVLTDFEVNLLLLDVLSAMTLILLFGPFIISFIVNWFPFSLVGKSISWSGRASLSVNTIIWKRTIFNVMVYIFNSLICL